MTQKEEASFRAIYAQWPTDRLARTATAEKKDYQPEAVVLMLHELEKRGLSGDSVSAYVSSTPPLLPPILGTMPERDTWILPARLDRKDYAIRTVSTIFATVAFAILLEFIPSIQPASFIILAVVSFLYGAIGLLLPRSKDAGIPSRMAMIFAVFPGIAFVIFFILFFIPTKDKKGPTSHPQRSALDVP